MICIIKYKLSTAELHLVPISIKIKELPIIIAYADISNRGFVNLFYIILSDMNE